MRPYVTHKFGMVFVKRIRHRFRMTVKQKIGQIAGRFPSSRHGAHTANAVYNNILTGELIRPHLYAPLHLFVGDGTIKIITAADRGGSAKLRFYNFGKRLLIAR